VLVKCLSIRSLKRSGDLIRKVPIGTTESFMKKASIMWAEYTISIYIHASIKEKKPRACA
jgi:hypothetical protein